MMGKTLHRSSTGAGLNKRTLELWNMDENFSDLGVRWSKTVSYTRYKMSWIGDGAYVWWWVEEKAGRKVQDKVRPGEVCLGDSSLKQPECWWDPRENI